MPIGGPRVKRPDGDERTEAEKRQREDPGLECGREVVLGPDPHVEAAGAHLPVDQCERDDESRAAREQEQRELHRGVFLACRAPYRDEQIDRQQSDAQTR